MNVKDEIRRAIKNGIHLGLSPKEEKKFMNDLLVFLINKNNFSILDSNTNSILVSTLEEDLADIRLKDGTLKIKPLSSVGYFSVFMDVLEYIAKKHKEEIAKLDGDLEDQEDISTEEDLSSDDGDWWL